MGARLRYVALAVGTIAVGLVVHWNGNGLPPVARDVLGDSLWAVMIVWWIAAVAPSARISVHAAVALVVCFAVELGQLIHSPGLDALRATTLGSLVLGSGFDPRDLVAYTAGVLAVTLVRQRVAR